MTTKETAFIISEPACVDGRVSIIMTFKVARIPLTLRIASGGKIEDVGVGQIDAIRLGQICRP